MLIEKLKEEMLENRKILSIEERLCFLEDLVFENCRQISELLGHVSRTVDQIGKITTLLNKVMGNKI